MRGGVDTNMEPHSVAIAHEQRGFVVLAGMRGTSETPSNIEDPRGKGKYA